MAERLRVLTMNVLAPEYADWPRRRRVIADELRALRPDVVALQEVTPGGPAELLGEGWHITGHPHRGPDGVGAALALRRPPRAVHRRDLFVTDRARAQPWCGVAAAEVPGPGEMGPLLVVHHKPSWPYDHERERELQAVSCARFVEEILAGRDADAAPPHVLLLGDFDAAPDAASIRFLTGRQSLDGRSVCYRDAWPAARPGEPGHTFSPRNELVRAGDMAGDPGRRIDYVMVRCGPHGPSLDVAACDRVLVDPVAGVQASDHYGVVADLVLPAREPGRWA
ncbi:endonuclease/exonuclease/phosphatase family protein [Streptomyces sp. NPDC048845]|uniref:endonuclease/exonuclease/phosphatase family protein n=1 Tax=Streptomyces sp. NPDC048845 TaxID=3155390 RepID=UPI00341DBC30